MIDKFEWRYNGKTRVYTLYEYCADQDAWYSTLLPIRKRSKKQLDIPVINNKYILIFKEKHYDRYFEANTTEQIGKACIKIILERFDYGYYDELRDLEQPEQPKLTLEQVEDDPEIQEVVNNQWKLYRNKLRTLKEREENKDLLNKVLHKQDYVAAYNFLEIYSFGEYEDMSLETLECTN